MSDANNTLLQLRESNPYRYGKVIIFDDNTMELHRDFLSWKGSETDTYYQVKKDDTADLVAWNVYSPYVAKAEWYWWIICDVNDIENPMDLSDYIGQEILIPDILLFLLTIASNK